MRYVLDLLALGPPDSLRFVVTFTALGAGIACDLAKRARRG